MGITVIINTRQLAQRLFYMILGNDGEKTPFHLTQCGKFPCMRKTALTWQGERGVEK